MSNGVQTQARASIAPGVNAPGALITFEGGDGCGKSTHVRFLAGLLTDLGLEVVLVREPGGTALGEALREILLDVGNEGMSDRSELLIYEAARAQLIDEVISPALAAGKVVVCDRFTDSTLAYQGYGRGLSLDAINAASDFATCGIRPDATIVLHCADREEKSRRIDVRGEADRLELAGDGFHERVASSFIQMASLDSGRMFLVDTTGKHSDTARAIFAALSGVVPALSDGTLDLEGVLADYDAAAVDGADVAGAADGADAVDAAAAADAANTAPREGCACGAPCGTSEACDD